MSHRLRCQLLLFARHDDDGWAPGLKTKQSRKPFTLWRWKALLHLAPVAQCTRALSCRRWMNPPSPTPTTPTRTCKDFSSEYDTILSPSLSRHVGSTAMEPLHPPGGGSNNSAVLSSLRPPGCEFWRRPLWAQHVDSESVSFCATCRASKTLPPQPAVAPYAMPLCRSFLPGTLQKAAACPAKKDSLEFGSVEDDDEEVKEAFVSAGSKNHALQKLGSPDSQRVAFGIQGG